MDAETAEYFEGINRLEGRVRKAELAARKAKSPGLSPELLEAYFDEGRSAASNADGESRAAGQATGPNAWAAHPLWSSWLALHLEVRAAFENSFPSYLDIRSRGSLPQFLEFAYQSIAEKIAAAEDDRARRDRQAANQPQTTHGGYRSPSRDRQEDFQRQLAAAKELHKVAVR